MGDPFEHQSWDSEHFGFPIARVVEPDCAANLERAVASADGAGVRCLTALVDSSDVEAISAAESLGFRCYDVRIEFDRDVRLEAEGVDGIHPASDADARALEPLAGRAFSESRFYVDPNFPEEPVRELYVAWLRRGFATESRLVLTTEGQDGFVICHVDAAAKLGTIELIAVDARSQGRGHGGELMQAAGRAFADAGLDRARVVTQGRNISAQRLYQRHGYRTSGTARWFHRWGLST